MAIFSYHARNSAGRAQQGTQEAPSAAALVSTLRQRGWLVLDVHAAQGPASARGPSPLNPLNWMPIRSVDIELGMQQLAVLLRSGLTLLAALKTIAEYARSRTMRHVWEDVAEKIQAGSSLADAMAEQRCFAHMVIELVRVGEQTGILEQVVSRAGEALERRRLLRNQVMTALFYPTVVFAAAIGTATFMIVSLIPKLQVFLTAIGRKLPPMTQRLLDISAFVQTYGIAIVLGLLALTAVVIALYLYPASRLIMDRLILWMPMRNVAATAAFAAICAGLWDVSAGCGPVQSLFLALDAGGTIVFVGLVIGHLGFLLRLSATVQFSHGLSVLLSSGITLVNGLQTVERQQRNRWAAGRVAYARQSVLRGGSLAEPLAVPGVFMPMLARMVAVGEASGTLDEVLAEVAKFHENRLQSTIRLLSTIIEPVIVVVVGGIVGFVYISFFLALFAAAGSPK